LKNLVSILLLFAFSNTSTALNDTYYSVGVGSMFLENYGYNGPTSYRYQPLTFIGVSAGKEFDSNLRAEVGFTTGVSGEIEKGRYSSDSFDYKSLSIMSIYKGEGSAHLRLKVGLSYSVFDHPSEIESQNWVPAKEAINFAYGLGYGFNTSSGKEFVIEVSQMVEKVTSLNFNINF